MWKYLTCPINNASFWLGFCPSRNQPRLEAPGAASRPQILSLEVVPFKGCRSELGGGHRNPTHLPGTLPGTLSGRQRSSGTINPSRRPRQIA
jgi:hypothetical protein